MRNSVCEEFRHSRLAVIQTDIWVMVLRFSGFGGKQIRLYRQQQNSADVSWEADRPYPRHVQKLVHMNQLSFTPDFLVCIFLGQIGLAMTRIAKQWSHDNSPAKTTIRLFLFLFFKSNHP